MASIRPLARDVGRYVLLAYGIAWAWWLPLALTHRVVTVGGWPTHLPGLVAPAIAAVVVTAASTGRAGLADLGRRVTRWRIGAWWWVAVSPLAIGVLAVAAGAVGGRPVPGLAGFGRINGFPTSVGLIGTIVLLLCVNALGEETGWRGYLQPRLQRTVGPRTAILVTALVWAGWHAPMFTVVSTYRGFTPATLVGFVLGLGCGAIVLGWLYNRTGSVLAVAVWHAAYNLVSASAAAHGFLAAVVTTAVILQAVTIVIADVATRGRTLRPARSAAPYEASEPLPPSPAAVASS